jgi:hydrogenase maturation protease
MGEAVGRSVLILGVGNPLAGDDGVGVRAIEALAATSDLPEGIRLLDVGVLGMDILAWTRPDEPVVILDAVHGPGDPGTLYRFALDEIEAPAEPPLSVHELGIADVLHAARLMGRPLRGTLVGVEPARLQAFTAGLSPPVAAALPALQAAAIREAELLLAGG